MPDEYYQSGYTGQQIDNAIGRIVNGELDKLAAGASNAAEAARSALAGVNEAIENIPPGSTPIVNDLTTGGQSMALSAEMGKVLGRRPNPNLLDNWYFIDPINQRGQTEYMSKGYTIDRWRALNDMSVSLGEQGLTLEMAFGQQFTQFLEDYSAFDGKSLTASVLFADNTLATGTIVYDDSAADWIPGTRVFFSTKNIQVVFTHDHGFLLFSSGDVDATIVAMKLELGSAQTLAHQDASGNWVLNDPPPDKGLELLKCIQSTADSSDGLANKTIFHTGNKPSGSYTGNGDAATRTIDTGGIGKMIAIISVNALSLISPAGGVQFNCTTGATTYASKSEISFSDGVLAISTASFINTYGAIYNYQVL